MIFNRGLPVFGEKIGEKLCRLGYIDEKNTRQILMLQRIGDTRPFGEIALELKFISSEALNHLLNDL